MSRRPSPLEEKTTSYRDYGPCPHCLGFMIKKHIWHHLKYSCKLKKNFNNEKNISPMAESTALINGILGTNMSAEFRDNVVNKLRNDDISALCKEDYTIVRYGAFLYEKYSMTQRELIRQSMRQLGRLKIELQKIN